MSFLDTKHKKKSFTVTTLLLTILLFLMFYIGLSYLDPPIENGISVNFGTTNFGSGNVQPKEKIKSTSVEKPIEKETPVKEIPNTAPVEPTETKVEDVVTQNNEESVVIKKQKEAEVKKKVEEEAKKKAQAEAERKERERKAERIKKEQEAKKKNLDAMMGGLNNSNGKATGGEGDDNQAGDKGQPDGDSYATSYYGGSGTGSGGVGYGLNGRSLISGDKFVQDCNESGTVVVKIEVDRSGKVISATSGVKGTTNTAPCLKEAASKTAHSYKWNPDANAPSRQIGFVVVNFKLGE